MSRPFTHWRCGQLRHEKKKDEIKTIDKKIKPIEPLKIELSKIDDVLILMGKKDFLTDQNLRKEQNKTETSSLFLIYNS